MKNILENVGRSNKVIEHKYVIMHIVQIVCKIIGVHNIAGTNLDIKCSEKCDINKQYDKTNWHGLTSWIMWMERTWRVTFPDTDLFGWFPLSTTTNHEKMEVPGSLHHHNPLGLTSLQTYTCIHLIFMKLREKGIYIYIYNREILLHVVDDVHW